jgi:hypothetical protein
MIVLFNIVMIALVALITYWWANQGSFSALLHLLCVIAAGAITLAFWEPIVVGLLLRGGWFDDYAWGVTFLVLFTVSLLVFRVALDKLVPANLNFPTTVNLVAGSIFGLGAGILTVGMLLIGLGFTQSSTEIMGYNGVRRDGTGQPVNHGGFWLPFHRWTEDFYAFTSAGAFKPLSGQSLRSHYPDISRVAWSQFRDSYQQGEAKNSINPDSVQVIDAYYCPARPDGGSGAYGVVLSFDSGAFDKGTALTLSASQTRLIGRTTGDREARVSHPDAWAQLIDRGTIGHYAFDDVTHYVSNVAGQENATVFMEFPDVFDGRDPRYIQIKGVRFPLPELIEQTDPQWRALRAGAFVEGGGATIDLNAQQIAASDIQIDNEVRNLNVITNEVAPMVTVANATGQSQLAAGTKEFIQGGPPKSRKLKVRGIYEPDGTKIVQVNVSRRNSSADLWSGIVRRSVSDEEGPVLVDELGGVYTPIGYVRYTPDSKIIIKLVPDDRITRLNELPELPSAGTHELWLVFRVTQGVTIKGLNVGAYTVGQTDLFVN